MATQDYQKAIAKEAAMKCFEITKGLVDVDSFGCSTIPIRLLHCITREFFHSCPIELQDQSERCVDMRKYVTRDWRNFNGNYNAQSMDRKKIS